MKKHLLFLSLLTLSFASCSSYKVAVPGSLRDNADIYHVKGTSVSIFGHKIKIEGFGEAKMYSGLVSRGGTDKRLFPLYFDLDKRLNYISNHFKYDIARSKAKFHFDFVSNDIYANTYCVARSSETSLNINKGSMNISLNEDYYFNGLIFTNKDSTPWKLTFNGTRNLKDGLSTYINNVRQTDGLLTNDGDIIDVKLVKINTAKENGTRRNIPFKIPVGYEFKKDGTLLAFVDLFDKNIWISKAVDAHTKVILVSAATSILVKANAS